MSVKCFGFDNIHAAQSGCVVATLADNHFLGTQKRWSLRLSIKRD
jgi:hypothetical protein